jgi:hypothetical protein
VTGGGEGRECTVCYSVLSTPDIGKRDAVVAMQVKGMCKSCTAQGRTSSQTGCGWLCVVRPRLSFLRVLWTRNAQASLWCGAQTTRGGGTARGVGQDSYDIRACAGSADAPRADTPNPCPSAE